MTAPYTKPAISIPEQITLLQERGLTITDAAAAAHCLKHISYYRLAGYWQIYQYDRIKHLFIPGTTFEQVLTLYGFDRELRLLLIDAIERIEVSFRAVLVDEMCIKHSSTWYAQADYAFSEVAMNTTLTSIDKELARSGEVFVAHHNRKYGTGQYPPAWKTFQVLSLGTLSKIYGNIRNDIPEKKAIARAYGLPAEAWLQSWMQVVSVLRNFCAHHSRICYRIFSYPPRDMHRPRLPWIKRIPPRGSTLSQHLYYQLCVVRYLLQTSSPGNCFNSCLKQLIARYPGVELNRMGFMPGWEHEPLWL
jgi:abortive infection bacteriophage resistance protein